MRYPRAGLLTLSGFLLTVIFLSVPCPGFALAQTNPQFGFLHWEAEFLGSDQPGSACWVVASGGDLRLEILLGEPNFSTPEDLMHQEGTGFTLVLSEGLDGTFNPWLSPWQKLNPGAGAWIQLATQIVSGQEDFSDDHPWTILAEPGTINIPRPRFWTGNRLGSFDQATRVQLPQLDRVAVDEKESLEKSFRGQNVARAAGHGGQEEILTLRRFQKNVRGYAWRLTSSRKPGQIHLSMPIISSIADPGLEVFAPLWPLGQLIDLNLFEIDKKNRELLQLRQVE